MITSSLPAGSLRRLLLAFAAGTCALPALANEISTVRLAPVVVTANRNATEAENVGSATTTVDATELRQRQQDSLAAALGATPGAPVAVSGATGAVTSVFLRGANSNQTLFLVDGIRLSDANADYAIVLGGATLGAGDTVEVARGPQSTLYGAEAIGGVVAIATGTGAGPKQATVATEGGSHGTLRGHVALAGGSGDWGYRLNLSGGHTDNERVNNAFGTAGANARLDRRLTGTFAVGATARWFHGEYGDPGDRFTNAPNDSNRENNLLVTLFADAQPAPGWSVHAIAGGQDRRFVANNVFISGFASTNAVTTNRRGVLDLQAAWTGAARHRLTIGTTGETTRTRNTGFGAIDRHQHSLAVFAQDEFSPTDAIHLAAGLRYDDFDTFGHATTGRLTAAWQVRPRWLKLRASYGTGFRAPSFLDLYGKSFLYVGNPSLKPEHARGWDAGLDFYNFSRHGQLGLSWFQTELSDLITGNFTGFPSTVANVAKARTRGLELSLRDHLMPVMGDAFALQYQVSYTYLEADNLTAGTRLLRRPRHSGSADLWHDFGKGLSAGAGLGFSASRQDIDARTFATIKAEDFTVARLYAAWEAKRNLTLKLRLENLLNEKYEPVNGYPATGFGAFGGIEFRW